MWKQNFIKGTNYLWDQQILFTPCVTNFLNFHSPPSSSFLSINTLCHLFSPKTHGAGIQKYSVRYINCNFPPKLKFEKNCKYKLNCAKDLFEKASWYSYYSCDLILEETSLRAKIVHRTVTFFFFCNNITWWNEQDGFPSSDSWFAVPNIRGMR